MRSASTPRAGSRRGAARTKTTLLLAAAALALARSAPATDPPAAGTIVDAGNVHEYAELLSPAMEWIVDRGVKLKVSEYRRIAQPPAFVEATEKYSAQVRLAPDASHLIDHVAGLPFPTVDPNDSQAGARHMFNFNAAIAVDDIDIRNFDCDTGSLGRDGKPVRIEKHFLIDHVRRLYFVERIYVDPKPLMPNKDKTRYKEALYPIREPFDLKGTGFTLNRYLDHTRQDDTWLYLPQLRRVRRLSSAQRSDALFGQDTDQDSYAGYAGNVAWMDWKYLGEKTLLASFHSEHLPVKWGEPSGDFMHDDLWEPRRVWIVEGVSKLPQYAYSKRVIFLDQDTYRIAYTDLYDRGGELWKIWVNNWKYAREPIPDAEHGFDWEFSYNASITMVDLQLEHTTHCALPSHRFPGEQGWYPYLGDRAGTTEDYFALSAIIAAGR